MPAKKARRSTRKPRDIPREPSVDSQPNVQLIIRDNLTKFMGRRFPEFCTLRAICLVNGKVSTSATGDARVASYQAAIDFVAKRYYADWPFMVEVLNKWLEMNKDFVRDPIGYATSAPLPTPPPVPRKGFPTTPTIQETPGRSFTSVVMTSDHTLSQISHPTVEDVPLSLHGDAEGPKDATDSSSATSATRVGPNDLGNPLSSSNNRRDIHVSAHKPYTLSWAGILNFLPPFLNLGIGTLPSIAPSSLFGGWFVARKPSAQRIPNPSGTRWFGLTFLMGSCKGCLGILKKPFAPGGRYPRSE